MKLQEIFDKAARHLMHMDGPSMDTFNDTCAYRGEDHGEFNGKMCAVGVFIKDEFYDVSLEGRVMRPPMGYANKEEATRSCELHNAVAKSLGQERLTQDQAELLADLQVAHDGESSREPDEWTVSVIKTLDQIAARHGFPFDPAHINPHYKGDTL
jgi:hypothetical protein